MQCVRSLTLRVLLLVVKVHSDFVEPPQSHTSLRSLAESQTRLPCRYQEVGGEKVVQVTWYKELAGGSKDQIITAHFSEGDTEFGRYSGRVKFESSSPTENSALLIPSTEESDDGSYICHISTFTNGNFERHITVTVWTLPISSLDPVILKEGDSYRLAASCKAVGRPRPRLSWDTDLPGQGKDKYQEGGSVSSYFSLHPLRSMNGKKLDCLVWHPGLNGPRRISNLVEVQYPPDATITSVPGDWFVGLENAELVCDSGGNPKPQDFTWTRRGGALPDGVSVIGGKLVFGRTLSLNDSGVYECVAKNSAGVGKAECSVTIAARRLRPAQSRQSNVPGASHLRRQPVHARWRVESSGRSGGGRAGTSDHLARWQGGPETNGDGRREGGAQDEDAVVPVELQQDTGDIHLQSQPVPAVQELEFSGRTGAVRAGKSGRLAKIYQQHVAGDIHQQKQQVHDGRDVLFSGHEEAETTAGRA